MSANIFHGSNVGGVRLYKSMDLFPMEKQKSMDKNSTVKFHGFTERTLNLQQIYVIIMMQAIDVSLQ